MDDDWFDDDPDDRRRWVFSPAGALVLAIVLLGVLVYREHGDLLRSPARDDDIPVLYMDGSRVHPWEGRDPALVVAGGTFLGVVAVGLVGATLLWRA